MDRRKFLGSLAAAAAYPYGKELWGSKESARQPNIVYIMADDLGYADVACYGRPDIKTPHIDSLAKDGTQLLQAYANSAVCSATRTALITGRYQYRLRVGLEEPIAGSTEVGLPPEHPTLPSLLKKAGYGTTLIGKWHLGVLPKFGPLKSGYDHFYGIRHGAADYYTHSSDLWDDDIQVDQHGYLTELLGSHAVKVIGSSAKQQRPFFLSLHFTAPHWPWEVPGDDSESQRLAQEKRDLMDFDGGSQKTYRAMVECMDEQIGRVLEALKAKGLTENTIVIFTSDNGGERFADTWPFTGRKTELLEGGLRIPALIRWPGRVAAGKTSNQVAISMDWLPTLLAAAGASADPAYPPDGINLLPQLLDRAEPLSRKLFWRYKANAQRAARDGDFKFLKIRENTFLFNVVEDPLERANLKEREKDRYERLRQDWFEWNSKMLPEVAESYTHAFNGKELADHYGAKPSDSKPDNPAGPDDD